jgi:hypothetical protein
MSTYYRPIPDILFDHLFDGRLEKHGIRERILASSDVRTRYLEGCDGTMEAHREDDGSSSFMLRGFPWAVWDALKDEFEVELVSEHDHRYWGFSSEEEYESFMDKVAQEGEDRFYNDLLHYLRGEPNGLMPGTNGMIMAEIAKNLVVSDPGLMATERRNELIAAVDTIYMRDHAEFVTLSQDDMASIEMVVARTDDLPQA